MALISSTAPAWAVALQGASDTAGGIVRGQRDREAHEIGMERERLKIERAKLEAAREDSEREAQLAANQYLLQYQGPDQIQGLNLPLPAAGPIAGAVGAAMTAGALGIHQRQKLEGAQRILPKLSPKAGRLFLEDLRSEMAEESEIRARESFVDNVGESLSEGHWNAFGSEEADEGLSQQVQQISEGVEQGAIPVAQAEQMLTRLRTSLIETNQRRMKRERVLGWLNQELEAAKLDPTHYGPISQTVAAYQHGAIDAEDAEDRIFEIKFGRKTARSAEMEAQAMRKDAVSQLSRDPSFQLAEPEEQHAMVQARMALMSSQPTPPVEDPPGPKEQATDFPAAKAKKLLARARTSRDREAVKRLAKELGVSPEDFPAELREKLKAILGAEKAKDLEVQRGDPSMFPKFRDPASKP